jgi:hypothetical protein
VGGAALNPHTFHQLWQALHSWTTTNSNSRSAILIPGTTSLWLI